MERVSIFYFDVFLWGLAMGGKESRQPSTEIPVNWMGNLIETYPFLLIFVDFFVFHDFLELLWLTKLAFNKILANKIRAILLAPFLHFLFCVY